MTAHPKIDPATGQMHFFGYGFVPPYLTYHVADADGTLIHQNTYFSSYRTVNGITVVGPTAAAPPPDEGETAGGGAGGRPAPRPPCPR